LSKLLIVNISQLVTLAGPARPRLGTELRDLATIQDGAMLVNDGRIVAVGTRSEIEPHAGDAEAIDAGGRLVTPGFVDAHTHLVFAGNRADEFEKRCAGITYQEISAQDGGIRSTVRKTRAAMEDQLFAAASHHAQWFLHG
jgi:imidazolonepropionase